ncbi:MAG: hypothetical protein ACLUTU_19190 [Blautia faecis]
MPECVKKTSTKYTAKWGVQIAKRYQ